MHRTMPLTLTLTLTLALTLTPVGVAGAAPAATEKCQAAKLDALRKRSFCIAGEERIEVLGKTPNTAKCAQKFDKAIAAADKAAAKKSASCRWLAHGDGTATDLDSGLQWELKTDDGSVHDKDNTYIWWDGVWFLTALNGAVSADGVTTTGCFAGHCDWRLPTIGELRGIVDVTVPGCGGGVPCTTIPGAFDPSWGFWSASTDSESANHAWHVFFWYGDTSVFHKENEGIFLAVRGGS